MEADVLLKLRLLKGRMEARREILASEITHARRVHHTVESQYHKGYSAAEIHKLKAWLGSITSMAMDVDEIIKEAESD